jgi:hypothetical protein
MLNFSKEHVGPDLAARQMVTPKTRGMYEHDVDSLEYLSICELSKNLRRQIYEQALILFKDSPKILQRLQVSDNNNNDNHLCLVLFNQKFPVSTINSLLVIKRFLMDRADLLVKAAEKSQILVLLNFVESLIAQELEKK